MAVWMEWVKARRLPAVLRKYKTTSQFRTAVRAEVLGSAAWARFVPGGASIPKSNASWSVDVEAIPLVRPLTPTGTLKT